MRIDTVKGTVEMSVREFVDIIEVGRQPTLKSRENDSKQPTTKAGKYADHRTITPKVRRTSSCKPWSPQDDSTIKTFYGMRLGTRMTRTLLRALKEALPTRSKIAIQARANKLGLSTVRE